MKKIGARLCKQQSALPWCVLWGKLCFRKVELLQASFCYMRTVHILPLGSHTTWRQVICSVSVTFLARLEQLLLQAPAEDVQKRAFFVCACIWRPRFLFLCGTFARAICILAPNWWLVAVSPFWSGVPPLSAFLFTCIHGFGGTSNHVLLFSYSWM